MQLSEKSSYVIIGFRMNLYGFVAIIYVAN